MRFDPLATPVPVGWNCMVPPATVTAPVKPLPMAAKLITAPEVIAVPPTFVLRVIFEAAASMAVIYPVAGTLVPPPVVIAWPKTRPVTLLRVNWP